MSGKVDKSPWGTAKHDQDITCIAFHQGCIFTGGADGNIKIWTEDLAVKKTLEIHDVFIYAIAITSNGKLYSCSCDGVVKFLDKPLESDDAHELVRSEDVIQSLYCDGDILYTGDDKGVVTMWENDKIVFKFNLIEEVKSLAVEKNIIYTARDLDAVISEVMAGKSGKYSTKKTIPGRAPLTLIGPTVNEHKSFLTFTTREGKGVTLANNLPGEHYKVLWTKEDCHEMIINAICGDESTLYTAGYDGMVKRWVCIDTSPKAAGEVDMRVCVNAICCGSKPNIIFTGTSDGVLRRLRFED